MQQNTFRLTVVLIKFERSKIFFPLEVSLFIANCNKAMPWKRNGLNEEPVSWSIELPQLAYVTPFLQADLFLEYLFFCERTGTAEREGLVAPRPNFVRWKENKSKFKNFGIFTNADP